MTNGPYNDPDFGEYDAETRAVPNAGSELTGPVVGPDSTGPHSTTPYSTTPYSTGPYSTTPLPQQADYPPQPPVAQPPYTQPLQAHQGYPPAGYGQAGYPSQPYGYQQPYPPQYAPPNVIIPVQQVVSIGGGYARPQCNHLLHFFLTLFTCGLWLPIWIIDAIAKSR